MNDTILSGLLNIFALFGSEKNLDKDESLLFISVYLKRCFRVRNPQSYLDLYSDLSIIVALFLFTDFPGRLVRKERN